MDAEHFDAITRRAATTSRRRVLGGLPTTMLVGLGVLRAPHSALADPGDFNKLGQSCDLSLDPIGATATRRVGRAAQQTWTQLLVAASTSAGGMRCALPARMNASEKLFALPVASSGTGRRHSVSRLVGWDFSARYFGL
jgi:hypothetical protein